MSERGLGCSCGVNQRFHRLDQTRHPPVPRLRGTGEVGELVEIFQWMTEEESRSALGSPDQATAIAEEMADVLLYLVRLADVLGINLDEAVKSKLALNAKKYPAAESRGSSKKRAYLASDEGVA